MTDDDTEIWLSLVGRGWSFWMPQNYLKADCRDADLMLSAQLYLRDHGPREYVLALGPIYCAGALRPCAALDELEGLL